MAISPKQADQFMNDLLADGVQAIGCLNSNATMMFPPDLYKQEIKQCAPILK